MTASPSTREVGDRFEKKTLKWHQRRDIPCRLTRSSGQLRRTWDDWRADLDVGCIDRRWLWKAEVKMREKATGFQRLEEWLGSNDVLVLGTGFVLLSEHGYAQAWGGVPSPMVAREGASTKTAQGFLERADIAIMWSGETFSVFLAWETFVDLLRGDRQ